MLKRLWQKESLPLTATVFQNHQQGSGLNLPGPVQGLGVATMSILGHRKPIREKRKKPSDIVISPYPCGSELWQRLHASDIRGRGCG